MRSTPDRLIHALGLFFLAGGLTACAHAGGVAGLNRGVRDFAPSYVASQPATADPALGRRLVNGQPEVNRCFLGDTLRQRYPGPDAVRIDYASGADARLNADFGPLITVAGNGARTGGVRIELANVTLVRLNQLFFDGAGSCASMGATRLGAQSVHRVVTRALKAGSVRIDWQSARSGSLRLDVRRAGGGVVDSTQHDVSYAGTNVYFAYYPERVQVTRTGVAGDTTGVGETVDVGPCGFTLSAVQDRWQGRLACRGGTWFDLAGDAGDYDGANVSPGVSYSVRVRQGAEVAQGLVDVWRYEVRTIR
ncbi:MAG: hypothetical protein P8099_06165 [Gemmatimonadota bacterium]|jgi:hypothetical protein